MSMTAKTDAPPAESPGRPAIAAIYDSKPSTYFANARHDIVALLETDSSCAILELGCGAGGTGQAALAAGKAGEYVGIELNEGAAANASALLSQVLVGDVQSMDLSRYRSQFDALIISEVLEHLTDPWDAMRKLAACLKPGAQVFASSPNISYWGVIYRLLQGQFRYTSSGLMDQTHLRWFTPESFRELFEGAGIEVRSLGPMRQPGWKGRLLNALTMRRFSHVLIAQMMVVGRRKA